jgi:hypothetical protein
MSGQPSPERGRLSADTERDGLGTPARARSLSNTRVSADAWRIDVACVDRTHKRGRVARIQTFEWHPRAAEQYAELAWLGDLLPGGWRAIEVGQAPRSMPDGSWAATEPATQQNLDADGAELGPGRVAPGGRVRFRFACRECKTVRAVRVERLVPILDAARHAGIRALPLDRF